MTIEQRRRGESSGNRTPKSDQRRSGTNEKKGSRKPLWFPENPIMRADPRGEIKTPREVKTTMAKGKPPLARKFGQAVGKNLGPTAGFEIERRTKGSERRNQRWRVVRERRKGN